MRSHKIRLAGLVLAGAAIAVMHSCGACKYYIKDDFRQTYADVNELLHQDTSRIPFFKIHFKDGAVSILTDWRLNAAKDSISGRGQLYDFNRSQVRQGALAFSLDDVAIIETNQLEAIRSRDNDRVGQLAILSGANIVLGVVCLINPKACFGSCPTFYIDGQSHFHSANAEGFSSAIAPALESPDLDALGYAASGGAFFLTMKNEALETHVVNELQLQAAPKSQGQQIFHDRHGNFYQCDPPRSSTSAKAGAVDIVPALARRDEAEYFSLTDSNDLAAREAVVLEFDRPANGQLGLVINFRQTLVTTFLLYSGLAFMGDEVSDYFARLETDRRLATRMADPFERMGGIDLHWWDDNAGKWRFFDKLHETGPIARNFVLAPLPQMKAAPGKLKVKIEMARGLWRLDYAGLTRIRQQVQPLVLHPAAAEAPGDQPDATNLVSRDDDQYLVSFPGDAYRFRFELPALPGGQEYELFLRSKGYYLEWMRREWIKGKDPERLRKFVLNDDGLWLELSREYKAVEQDMERIFWDSKFSTHQ